MLNPKKVAKAIAREAHFLQKAEHDNVVKYVDHSSTIEGPYLVMEHVPQTMRGLVEENAITQEVVIDYLKQVPEILFHLRKAGIAHSDLKCSNLGYNDGTVKLLDFGLAVHFEHSFFRNVKEVPCYNSPELREHSMVTPSSDTYSAGRALEFMLTSRLERSPEDSLDNMELFYDIVLPDSFKKMFSLMVNEDFAVRPNPQKLKEIIDVVIEDLNKDIYFTTEAFTCFEKGELSQFESAFMN
jgi:serine/threonine protein kinase